MSEFYDESLAILEPDLARGGYLGMTFRTMPLLAYCRECGNIESIYEELPHAPHCSRCGAPMFTGKDVPRTTRRRINHLRRCPDCGSALRNELIKCRECEMIAQKPLTWKDEPTEVLQLELEPEERKRFNEIIKRGRKALKPCGIAEKWRYQARKEKKKRAREMTQ